jgi:hypothetical protein
MENQPNGPTMDETLLPFINAALTDKTNSKMIFEFHSLSEGQVVMLLEKTGHDLQGYKRVLDSFAVRHVFKNHGNDKTEALRGQIGVVAEDFLLIEQIVTGYDTFWVENNRIGNILFKYKLRLDDFIIIFAEEIRVGKKELAAQTLYKQKIRKP